MWWALSKWIAFVSHTCKNTQLEYFTRLGEDRKTDILSIIIIIINNHNNNDNYNDNNHHRHHHNRSIKKKNISKLLFKYCIKYCIKTDENGKWL